MERVTRSKVQKLESAPQQLMDVNSKKKKPGKKVNSRSPKVKTNIAKKIISPEPNLMIETPFQNMNPFRGPEITNEDFMNITDTSEVQEIESAPQQLMTVNSKKKKLGRRFIRWKAKMKKNIAKKMISLEPNLMIETPRQRLSPFKVVEIINDDVINISDDATNDSQHENIHVVPSKSTVSNITNNDVVDITIESTAQNYFQPIPSKIENDEIIDITDTTVYEDKTIKTRSPSVETLCNDDVQFISCSSYAKNNVIEHITIIDSSDEENTPHKQPIKKSVRYKSIKESLEMPVQLNNPRKRKYNSPLRNCKRTKIDEFRLNGDLGEFVIDKQRISQFSNNLKNIGHNATTFPQNHLPVSSASSTAIKKLRPIIIDGLNIGHAHGGQGIFSVKGIDLCIQYFTNRGHTEITAFIPQHRQGPPGSESNTILNKLVKKGHICYTPSRKVQNLRMTCYDDRIMLDYAHRCGGVVVSNDNYRDLYNESDAFKDIIENRQVMVTFVRDEIIVPEDQYNRRSNVRSLSDILCFPS